MRRGRWECFRENESVWVLADGEGTPLCNTHLTSQTGGRNKTLWLGSSWLSLGNPGRCQLLFQKDVNQIIFRISEIHTAQSASGLLPSKPEYIVKTFKNSFRFSVISHIEELNLIPTSSSSSLILYVTANTTKTQHLYSTDQMKLGWDISIFYSSWIQLHFPLISPILWVQMCNRTPVLQTGGMWFERQGQLVRDHMELHFGKCRFQHFDSMTNARD